MPLAKQRTCIAQHLFRNIWNLFNLGEPLARELASRCQWHLGVQLTLKHFAWGLLPLWSVGEAIIVRPFEFPGSEKWEFWCVIQAWFLLNIYFLCQLPEPYTVITAPGNCWDFTSSGPKPLGSFYCLSIFLYFFFLYCALSIFTCLSACLQMMTVSDLNSWHLATGLELWWW